MITLRMDVPRWLQPGDANRRIDRGIERGLEDVGNEAVTKILRPEMRRLFRDPTPRYWVHVGYHQIEPDLIRIDDDGIVYGPWLEGTSQRNRISRFKGYAIWRRSRDKIEKLAGKLLRAAVIRELTR